MWKDYKVIDADAHMHEPKDMWERHLEPRYRDRAPKVAYMNGTFMVYEPDGKIISKDEKQLKAPPIERRRVAVLVRGNGCSLPRPLQHYGKTQTAFDATE